MTNGGVDHQTSSAPRWPEPHACGCAGLQNGQPLCPSGVRVEDCRYAERHDARASEAFRKMFLAGMTKGVSARKPRYLAPAGRRVI